LELALFLALIVVGHLQAGTPEATLDVKALVGFAAVQDGLIAADLFGNEIEGLNQAKAELLALLILCYGNVLDMTDKAETVNTTERAEFSN